VLAAALLVAGVGRDQLAVLSSTVVQGRSGARAELSRRDFVPLGSDGSARMTALAKRQLDGLFAAAGVNYGMGAKKLKARQSMLAQVPGRTSYAKRHLDIDRGSSKRLVAAAENRLHAYDRRVHLSRHNKEVKALKQDLGSKIAQYFSAAQQVAGGKL